MRDCGTTAVLRRDGPASPQFRSTARPPGPAALAPQNLLIAPANHRESGLHRDCPVGSQIADHHRCGTLRSTAAIDPRPFVSVSSKLL